MQMCYFVAPLIFSTAQLTRSPFIFKLKFPTVEKRSYDMKVLSMVSCVFMVSNWIGLQLVS